MAIFIIVLQWEHWLFVCVVVESHLLYKKNSKSNQNFRVSITKNTNIDWLIVNQQNNNNKNRKSKTNKQKIH